MYEQRCRLSLKLACVTLILLVASFAVLSQTRRRTHLSTKYVPVAEYDPKRDADQDLKNAIKEARRSHRHILVVVGGEWCSWCHTLDQFFQANPELLKLRDKNFVTVKINFSEENENNAVLSRYPPVGGYPHFFFLDSQGKLLITQPTDGLESGKSYDAERFTVLLTNWGPKR